MLNIENQSSLKKNFGSGSPKFSFGSSERLKESIVYYIGDSNMTSEKIRQLLDPGNYNLNDADTKKKTSQNWR